MPILSLLRALFRLAPAAQPLSREEAVAAARDLVQQAEQSGESALLYRAIKLDPDNIEPRRLLARSLMVSNAKTDQSEAQAIPVLNELVAREPSNPEFLFMRGVAHRADFGKDSALKALDDFAAVIRIDPTFDFGWPHEPCAAFRERASIFHSKLKEVARAMEELDQAIRLCPEQSATYSFRSRLRSERGDLDGAIADSSEAIRCMPSEYSYTVRGELYLETGELDRAIADFTAAIDIHPWHGPYFGRGQALERKGDLDAALADYASAGGSTGGWSVAETAYQRVQALIAKRHGK